MTENLTIVTLKQPQITHFARARNQALKAVKTDWALFLDADEKLTPALKTEIGQAIQNRQYNYQLKRRDYFLGKKLTFGETAHVRLTRLIQPGTGRWRGRVHEVFNSKLALKTLQNPLIHQREISLSQFIDRLNRYTSLRARELYQTNHQFKLSQLIFFPPLKFIQNYFLRLGFLDGLPGLAIALLMSFHSFWVRIKLYELQKNH